MVFQSFKQQGKIIYSERLSGNNLQHSIDAKSFAEGIYVLGIFSDEGAIS